jgi:hypothetical protein
MSDTLTGLFREPRDAAAAIHTLEAGGVPGEAMGLVAGQSVERDAFTIDSHSKLPEGVALGAGGGGAVGALVAGLTSVGAVATGGAGLLAAGPIVAALAGAGAGAAGGGVLGGAIGVAIPEDEVKRHQEKLEEGAVLVSVECADEKAKQFVDDTFKRFDAETIESA